jgi:hypothetical protein
VAAGLEQFALGGIVVLIRDANLDRSLLHEDVTRGGKVGEPIDLAALLGDLVAALEVLDEHDEAVPIAVPERELGSGRPRQFSGLPREGLEHFAQVQRRRDLVRKVQKCLQAVRRRHYRRYRWNDCEP